MKDTESYTELDIEYLNKAIELSGWSASKDGVLAGGPFGAIIVDKNGNIIGQAINNVLATNDPTAHAEIMAIRMACNNIKSFNLNDSILYTSCEPCPMCLMASKWANIKKIFYAATRKDADKIGFQDANLYKLLKRGKYAIFIKECRPSAVKAMKKWKKKFGDLVNY